jgi:hypothetical protein
LLRQIPVEILKAISESCIRSPGNALKNGTMKKPSHVPIYRNPKAPAEKRTKDPLARLTLEEKATKLVDTRGKFEQSYL